MELRRALALWLCPELASCEDKYQRMQVRLYLGYRWLAEFDQICAFIEWCRGEDTQPWDIGEFREKLRAKDRTDAR